MTHDARPAIPHQRHDGTPEHITSVTEKGAFAVAHCSCGWHSPARRSRDRARRDAEEHHTASAT
ncbi:hypothetical protein DN069_16220 [Streptacidiphilus pinicola]|uniref:Uncharacterized protein n=1 Tax=Streptacidiphilus pinicola TaxID=2219663 RepID=A0A2X0KC51_9ACTN|nr:hypothetical protein [Streptacidiphilus pinicola]RAG84590.1 hypothetical protein DN069_16220 [Streptacidiphilus pinicola]